MNILAALLMRFADMNRTGIWLIATVGGVLLAASLVGGLLSLRQKRGPPNRTIANLNARIRAWWVMAGVFGLAIYFRPTGATVLFGIVSFLALREMVTLIHTRRADHHTLFWAFFVITPLQFYLVEVRWYGFFAVFIPVYCTLFVAIRSTLTGDYKHYLERTSKIQWAIFICVYCVSHAPALMLLELPGRQDRSWELLVWLVIVVQMSDVLQYVWGNMLGRHKVAPHISPNKTWEGLIGGILSATGVGLALIGLTPFSLWQGIVIGLTTTVLGFFGGIVMSAIKRDAGVKDYGRLIEGHGGMMDRIDSITFAAPVFFHVVRYWFASPG